MPIQSYRPPRTLQLFTPNHLLIFMKPFGHRFSLLLLSLSAALPCAADTLWISAIDMAAKTSMVALIGAEPGQDANAPRIAQLQTFASGEHTISFTFRTRDSGTYAIWAATTPPVTSWASPFQILLDGQIIYSGGQRPASGTAYGPASNPGLFRWYHFAKVTLDSGVHELTFSVTEPRTTVEPSGRAFAFYLDSILITDNASMQPEGAGAIPGAAD